MSERSESEKILGCIFPSVLFPFFALHPFRALCVVGRALCVVVVSTARLQICCPRCERDESHYMMYKV